MLTPREAYVWRRQLSYDQISKIEYVSRFRQLFDAETIELAAFARCQLQHRDRWYNAGHAFEGMWEGRPARFQPIVRPLFMEDAIKVYSQTLRDAAAYYPNFARHVVVDGPLVGERRIVFPDQLDEAAACWMRWRFRELLEKGDITVGESFKARVDRHSSEALGRECIVVDVVLDVEQMTDAIRDKVAAAISAGQPFAVDARPRRSTSQLVYQMLVELSLPELVALNWDRVKKPLSDADRQLFAAIDNFDIDSAKVALDAGADPNALTDSSYPETPLTALIQYRRIEHLPRQLDFDDDDYRKRAEELGPQPDEVIPFLDLLIQAGAAVNWASYGKLTPLAEASCLADAEIVSYLLEHGADPSIQCYTDQDEGEGSAWHHASARGDTIIDNADPSAENALLAKWPSPWDGIRIE